MARSPFFEGSQRCGSSARNTSTFTLSSFERKWAFSRNIANSSTEPNRSRSSTRLEVTSVGASVSLSKLQAVLVRDKVTAATLGPPLGGSNATLAFTDADGDGHLSPGDFFLVPAGSTACFRLDINQIEPGSTFVVGQQAWGLCSST